MPSCSHAACLEAAEGTSSIPFISSPIVTPQWESLEGMEPVGEMSALHDEDKVILWERSYGDLALRLMSAFFLSSVDPGFSWEQVLATPVMRWRGRRSRENSTSPTPVVWGPDNVFCFHSPHPCPFRSPQVFSFLRLESRLPAHLISTRPRQRELTGVSEGWLYQRPR